jgi:hypothetical protein
LGVGVVVEGWKGAQKKTSEVAEDGSAAGREASAAKREYRRLRESRIPSAFWKLQEAGEGEKSGHRDHWAAPCNGEGKPSREG